MTWPGKLPLFICKVIIAIVSVCVYFFCCRNRGHNWIPYNINMTSPPQPQQIYYGPHSGQDHQNLYTVAYSAVQGVATLQPPNMHTHEQGTTTKLANKMPISWVLGARHLSLLYWLICQTNKYDTNYENLAYMNCLHMQSSDISICNPKANFI